MKNKIFTILGILLIVVSVASIILFNDVVKKNSEAMGVNVLVAKENIAEGVVIKSAEQAEKLFTSKRVAKSDLTEKAIEVNSVSKSDVGAIERVKNYFNPTTNEVSKDDLIGLVGKKIDINIYRNQQVTAHHIVTDSTELAYNERYYAVPTDYISSVGGETNKGDFVDLWIRYGGKTERSGQSDKVIGPLKVEMIKDANNTLIEKDGKAIPNVVIFKVKEEQIKVISEYLDKGNLFLVKWGVNPNRGEEFIVKEEFVNEEINEEINQETESTVQ